MDSALYAGETGVSLSSKENAEPVEHIIKGHVKDAITRMDADNCQQTLWMTRSKTLPAEIKKEQLDQEQEALRWRGVRRTTPLVATSFCPFLLNLKTRIQTPSTLNFLPFAQTHPYSEFNKSL